MKRTVFAGAMLSLALTALNASAENVPVRFREGLVHGFLVLRSMEGRILASGDLLQTTSADTVTTELVFHFKDGSVHDETAVFSQDRTFRLLSDKLVQKGPSFPHPVDMLIDTGKGAVELQPIGKERQEKSHQLELPDDLANGIFIVLLRNLSPTSPKTTLSWLATPSKPRIVKLSITPAGEKTFSIAGARRKATDFDLKFEIGGVQGLIAPLVGKQPPDIHVWISRDKVPTFVRYQGPLYEGGPIWRIELVSPTFGAH